MSNIAIEFSNVGKQYRLGRVGTGTLGHDLNRWWQTSILGREDPYLKIGETNDRTKKGESDYVWALKDISFQVEQGDVVGIIGKNGAGKSTLLKLLSHITSPSTGTIKYKGRIASLLEVGTGFHPELTGRENIYMNGSIMGMTKAEITRKLDEIVDFAGVERYLDTPVKRYSSGMTVRLGFAVAAFLEPEILVVDEVLTVGDTEFQKKAIGKMNDVATNGGRTVLFVSHNMAAVRALCRNGVVLKDGMIDYIGTAGECVDRYMESNKLDDVVKKEIATESTIDKDKEVCFLSIEFEKGDNTYCTTDTIPFICDIVANKDVKSCRLNMTIYTSLDMPVGSVSSQDFFSIKKGEKKRIRLSVFNHNMAGGDYYVSFSLGIGNFSTSQRDFDMAIKALTFKIDKYSIDSNVSFVQWRTGYGPIFLPYKIEEI